MYFFVFAPLLEDKKVINEIYFFAFSRLNQKDPTVLLSVFFGSCTPHQMIPLKFSVVQCNVLQTLPSMCSVVTLLVCCLHHSQNMTLVHSHRHGARPRARRGARPGARHGARPGGQDKTARAKATEQVIRFSLTMQKKQFFGTLYSRYNNFVFTIKSGNLWVCVEGFILYPDFLYECESCPLTVESVGN